MKIRIEWSDRESRGRGHSVEREYPVPPRIGELVELAGDDFLEVIQVYWLADGSAVVRLRG